MGILLPTLPNLYGLDTRFRYVEQKLKLEKEKRSIKATNNQVDGDFLMEMFNHKPNVKHQTPLNRHGQLLFNPDKKSNVIQTHSYRTKRGRSTRFNTVMSQYDDGPKITTFAPKNVFTETSS